MSVISKAGFEAALHLFLLVLLAAAVTFHVSIAQPLVDPFQEAEYAMFGFLEQTQPAFHRPVLIHGGLDVLPSKLAASACSADAQIACVRTINSVIQFGAACLFVAVVAVLGGLGGFASLLASLPAAAMLWLFDGPTINVVDAHQGTPGVRDLFVMAALLLMARICRRIDLGEPKDGVLSLLILGALAGTGLFWAYNRGLLLLILLTAFTVAICLMRRSLRPAMPAIAGFVVALAIIFAISGSQAFANAVSDIRYWSQNEAIWHIGIKKKVLAPIIALVGLLLAASLPVAWISLRSRRPGQATMLAILGLTLLLYAAQSLNRPDVIHLRWVVWPAMLMLAIVIRYSLEQSKNATAWPRAVSVAMLPLLVGLCLDLYADNSIARSMASGLVENAQTLTHILPRDRDLAGRDFVQVADLVAMSGRCTFAANNAGMIHLLSHKLPCSRFVFGSYIATDRQTEVIADLEAGQPDIILWDSAAWWSDIDGRDFKHRTPILARWIERHYADRKIVGQYVLLSRAQEAEIP